MYCWSSTTTQSQHGRTTLIVGNSILSGLKESKMSQKMLIEVRTVPGATIQDMKFFVVPHLKKKPDNIIIHVGTNNAPHSSSYEIFHEIQRLRNFILKYLPSARITISTPALHVDKTNANDINKAFTELVKESNLDYIFHENIRNRILMNMVSTLIEPLLQFWPRIRFQEFVTPVFWTPRKKLT